MSTRERPLALSEYSARRVLFTFKYFLLRFLGDWNAAIKRLRPLHLRKQTLFFGLHLGTPGSRLDFLRRWNLHG